MNIALFGRFGELSVSIFREQFGPSPTVCPSRIGFFAVVFIRLSMCLYRGFASWTLNLGKLLRDCMASHPRELCSTGYQTTSRHLPPRNDANT